ncbi:MAG: hypothetical protein OZSIB_1610 [Candidatus Ozemobacter sibiricus]|uniref:Uncharacterized protein n=1 Tax=Candidatus Ozemobacter sibiricus TaxID=2268124 RepID=A0A367ZJC5_9BACT|nr:MAG: hypothetical protein OZSIB_1610 [Candidatus Ozemobacter sibiricus]
MLPPTPDQRQAILAICRRFGVSIALIENLLQLQHRYRSHLKRRGIFEEIRRLLRTNLNQPPVPLEAGATPLEAEP